MSYNKVIIEKPARKVTGFRNKKPILVQTGGYRYYLLELDKPGILDEGSKYITHYDSKKQALEENPGVEFIDWNTLNERYKETRHTLSFTQGGKGSTKDRH